ncbi:hypothetical protein KCP77_10955 [Salmonella enterica subsp. enterica]|nr:hypothetical protein KCP77_10955 [Salmonella enterica subsp. enterica]
MAVGSGADDTAGEICISPEQMKRQRRRYARWRPGYTVRIRPQDVAGLLVMRSTDRIGMASC